MRRVKVFKAQDLVLCLCPGPGNWGGLEIARVCAHEERIPTSSTHHSHIYEKHLI